MRIKSVPDDQAAGQLAVQYAEAKADSVLKIVPPIIQTMSLRPDFMAAIRRSYSAPHRIAEEIQGSRRCHREPHF